MKMKKFFSGFLAAIMSIATIAMPLSTAIAEDDPPAEETGKIIINHAATTGTYTAYPIFVGTVEQAEDDKGKPTDRLVIDTPEFHPNLETTIGYNEQDVIARVPKGATNNEDHYGLYSYLNNRKTINSKTFEDLMKEYDSKAIGISSINSESKTASSNKDAAEAIANLLNLTLNNSPGSNVNNITGSDKKGAAFYSAFAEAARMFMVDNIVVREGGENVKKPGTLTDVKTGGAAKKVGNKNVVEIEITRPGYYLVEYTPDGTDTSYDTKPKMVRRSLVLVGLGDDCKATINSKDTTNVASVDIQFNETMLVKNETKDEEGNVTDTSYTYNGTEGTWSENVSAGNGDYVSCRVVVTLPGNLAAYDQYYLAVPIMYGYNIKSVANLDGGAKKSIIRVEDDKDPLKYLKAYFIEEVEEEGEDGSKKTVEKKTLIIKDPDSGYSENNSTDSASEIFNNDHNAELTIDKSYTYADETANSNAADVNDFKAYEAFVISDIANMIVRAKDEENKDAAIFKSNYANPQSGDGWNKFVIEFPVKFERFDTTKLNDSATAGVSTLGYFNSTYGDDLLMKNYISAKLVYSNNPNLEVPRNEDGTILSDEEKANLTGSDMLYLDTSKAPGTLYNPVFATKKGDCVSANIVTYRLRVHATTEDLFNLAQGGGLEGIRFAIKRQDGCYAVVEEFASAYQTYDEVDGEKIREKYNSFPSATDSGSVYVYKIVSWVDPDDKGEVEGEDKSWGKDENGNYIVPNTSIMYTFKSKTLDNGGYRNNNTARFEIVGIAPGDYTIVALDKTIKANDFYAASVDKDKVKEYKLRKEEGQSYLKTEYRFSFAPTLSETCTKLPYSTHYAPVGVADSVITDDQVLIEKYNLKWYGMDGKELTETSDGNTTAKKPVWWLGQREDVGLMSMRVTYIKKGITLPVTGGIGTFIFFAVGGALVVISMVAIVTKFRMKREQL